MKELWVIIMIKQTIHNLFKNSWYVILGIANCLVSYDLLTNEHFFFWPPQFRNLMNDDRADWIFLIIGIAFFIYAAIDRHSNWIITFLLAVSAAFYTLLGFLAWEHMQFAGVSSMGVTASLCFVMVLVILNVARNRDAHR